MASTKILITTVPDNQGKTSINITSANIGCSTNINNIRNMLPVKTATADVDDIRARTRPHCLAFLDSTSSSGPRKRQRLNHLTPDEKMMRRKMKNRVAAQTARDRKKALMEHLEDQIYDFESEKMQLLDENAALHAKNEKLEEENQELRKRLGLQDVKIEESCEDTFQITVKEEDGSTESAEGAGPISYDADGNSVHMEPDVLLGILGELDDRESSLEESRTTNSQAAPGEGSNPSSCDTADDATTVVGTSSADMESIKELIRFDHVYYKRPAEKVIDLKEEETQNIDELASLAQTLYQTQADITTPDEEGAELNFLLSLQGATKDVVKFSNPFNSSNLEDPFDCDIAGLLTCDDMDMCDSVSDSGKSTGSSVDSGVLSDSPCSPGFADELNSPVLPNGGWEESFIDLFPSLDM